MQGKIVTILCEGVKIALHCIWDLKVPQKVKIFGWRLLQDRLPTRDHLGRRGIIVDSENCRCFFVMLWLKVVIICSFIAL